VGGWSGVPPSGPCIDDASQTRGWMSVVGDQTGRVTADELRYLAQPVVDALG
jgi:hypothetical protein